jgi:predicted Ser/Thr protein kinase
MPDKPNHLLRVEQKITKMITSIQNDQGDLKSAKLVGFYINKQGLRNNPNLLIQILPKLIKILFDANEISQCLEIMEEAIICFPSDEKLKRRLNKLQDLGNLNAVNIKKPEKEKGEKFDDTSSFDLASEITNLDSLLKDKGSFSDAVDTDALQDVSNQLTKVSTGISNIVNEDQNEKTLAPTPTPMVNSNQSNAKSKYGASKSTLTPRPTNLPSDVIANYPGLSLLSARYEYVKMLGEGGMGGVFLAIDRQLERNVAIKFMNSACISNPEVAERFIREARAQAVASHPGIVSIYDVGNEDNPFIVMEYVEGKTIKDVIKKDGGFSLKEAVRIMTLVAEALEYAHYKKITHRDVKPDNIIIDEFGKTRLLDFGLAKLDHAPSMTINDQIMGTPYYMSPEQIKCEEVGPPTDIYAWGVMFYQITTGLVPFYKGDILYHHVHTDPVPPKLVTMDISDSLNQIIIKSMEKELTNRYKNFKEVLADLQTGMY